MLDSNLVYLDVWIHVEVVVQQDGHSFCLGLDFEDGEDWLHDFNQQVVILIHRSELTQLKSILVQILVNLGLKDACRVNNDAQLLVLVRVRSQAFLN